MLIEKICLNTFALGVYQAVYNLDIHAGHLTHFSPTNVLISTIKAVLTKASVSSRLQQ